MQIDGTDNKEGNRYNYRNKFDDDIFLLRNPWVEKGGCHYRSLYFSRTISPQTRILFIVTLSNTSHARRTTLINPPLALLFDEEMLHIYSGRWQRGSSIIICFLFYRVDLQEQELSRRDLSYLEEVSSLSDTSLSWSDEDELVLTVKSLLAF